MLQNVCKENMFIFNRIVLLRSDQVLNEYHELDKTD